MKNTKHMFYVLGFLNLTTLGYHVLCSLAEGLRIGNVKEHTLEELWHSKTVYELRCDMLKTKGAKWEACRNCEIPYRDAPEDDVSGVEIKTLKYKYESI